MLSIERLAGLAPVMNLRTLALKPRADITTSPNRCISGLTKMNYVLQDLKNPPHDKKFEIPHFLENSGNFQMVSRNILVTVQNLVLTIFLLQEHCRSRTVVLKLLQHL